MPWLNIRQNISGNVKRYFSYNGEFYAIVEPSAGGAYVIYKLDAARAGSSWETTTYYLATAPNDEYDIVAAVEDTASGAMYVANAAHGEVYINRSGDFTDTANWVTTTGPFAGGYVGEDAQLKDLVYYNRKVYLSHRGGVSYYNYEQNNESWEQVADFTTGVEGIGECSGMIVLNGVLYVIVSFESLYAIYQYDANQETFDWVKFAEYPRELADAEHATKARYLAARNNIIFATEYGLDLNVFNSRGLDSTLTGQPRFTQGKHLNGVPSSIINFSERGSDYLFITCWDAEFSGSAASTYGDNLISTFSVVDVGLQSPGETWFTTFTPAVDASNTINSTLADGAFRFTTKSPYVLADNSANIESYKILYHIKTNTLTLLPGETYTITWEQSAQALASKLGGSDAVGGSGFTTIGFSNLNGDGIDSNSPNTTKQISGQLFTLVGSQYEKVSFTFNANDINFATTDGSIYIQGIVSVKLTVPQLATKRYAQFLANAAYKNIQIFRGTADEANAEYLSAEYITKEYADISVTEKDNHIIEAPSPPDQWFLKFPKNSALSITNKIDRLSRRIKTNKMTLLPDENYKFHFIVKKADDGIPTKTYRIRTISPISGISTLSATCAGIEQRPFEWIFSTEGISANQLKDIEFEIEVWEEEIAPGNGATFYFSDINIQQKISDAAENTIYRYDGQAWDDIQTKTSNDNGVLSQPYGLHSEYESISGIDRLYCIANGEPYVWSTGPDDPFGGEVVPRIVITWDSSDQ